MGRVVRTYVDLSSFIGISLMILNGTKNKCKRHHLWAVSKLSLGDLRRDE